MQEIIDKYLKKHIRIEGNQVFIKDIKIKVFNKFISDVFTEPHFSLIDWIVKRGLSVFELVYENGSRVWYKDGKVHRDDDLPAIVWTNRRQIVCVGTQTIIGRFSCWVQKDKLHRVDGPALQFLNGMGSWYKNGKRHREDGPAKYWRDGRVTYYLNGQRLDDKAQYLYALTKYLDERNH